MSHQTIQGPRFSLNPIGIPIGICGKEHLAAWELGQSPSLSQSNLVPILSSKSTYFEAAPLTVSRRIHVFCLRQVSAHHSRIWTRCRIWIEDLLYWNMTGRRAPVHLLSPQRDFYLIKDWRSIVFQEGRVIVIADATTLDNVFSPILWMWND